MPSSNARGEKRGQATRGKNKKVQGIAQAAKDIGKPGIRRLARKGGVKRIHKEIYEETRANLVSFLTKIIDTSCTLAEHAKKKTINSRDLVESLRWSNRKYYGMYSKKK